MRQTTKRHIAAQQCHVRSDICHDHDTKAHCHLSINSALNMLCKIPEYNSMAEENISISLLGAWLFRFQY